MKKMLSFVLALALFAVCIPTGLAAKPTAPKASTSYFLYQYGSGGNDCVAVAGSQVNTKSAAVYRTKMTKGAKNQQIVLTPSGGYYYIHWLGYSGAHSGRDFVLDQSSNGVVTQYTRVDGKDNQLWKLVADSSSGAYRLQNKKSELYLTYQQSSNGYVAASYKNNSTQLFQFYTGDAAVPAFLKVSSSGSTSATQADKVVSVALSVKGKNGAYFGWYEDWCAYYVCWAGQKAGADFPQRLENPARIVKWFVSNNKGTAFVFRDKNYADLANPREDQWYKMGTNDLKKIVRKTQNEIQPQKGDIICFRWNGAGAYCWSHCGLVVDAKNGFVYTVEGNSGGRVSTRQYTYPNNGEIVALVRPNYK